ncbi:MAG: hypothetical protein NC489_40125 [Ruminococcus flavefaciens]|nr:hypothetical protein [Ruminococcus flavefaciens]
MGDYEFPINVISKELRDSGGICNEDSNASQPTHQQFYNANQTWQGAVDTNPAPQEQSTPPVDQQQPPQGTLVDPTVPGNVASYLVQQVIDLTQENKLLISELNKAKKQKATTTCDIVLQDKVLNLRHGYELYPLCADFLTFAVWVTVENVEKNSRFMAVGILEEKIIFLKFKDLQNDTALKQLRVETGFRMEINGKSDSQIYKALNPYLIEKANDNEEILIPQKAGWDLKKKIFISIRQDELFRTVLKSEFPNHPLVRRELSIMTLDENQRLKTNHAFSSIHKQILWEVFVFAAVSRSLLVQAGVQDFFGLWIYDNDQAHAFKRSYLTIWKDYIPEADAGSIIELKRLFADSKDEIIVIRDRTHSKRAEENMKRIVDCISTNSEFAANVPIDSLPVFVSKDYSIFQDEKLTVFPLLFSDDDTFKISKNFRFKMFLYLQWCEENFSLVQELLSLVSHVYEIDQENREVPLLKTFIMVETLLSAYDCDEETIYSVIYEPDKLFDLLDLKDIEQTCTESIQKVITYNQLSALELVRLHLKKAYNSKQLRISAIDQIYEQKELQNTIIYDRNFFVYIAVQTFEKLLSQSWYPYVAKNLIKRLVDDDILETERNGEGKRRADIKASIPRGCGRNQNRFYKFKPGILLNESGYLIGTTPKLEQNACIKLGKDEYGYNIFYPYQNAQNFHITVTGISGSGKTFTTYGLVYQLCREGIPCLLLDYSNSYDENALNHELTDVIDIRKFPVNPFERRMKRDTFSESCDECAWRGMEILSKVLNLKDHDRDIVFSALKELLEESECANFDLLFEKIKDQDLDKGSKLGKIRGLCNKEIFHYSILEWDQFFNDDAKLKIIKMDSLSTDDAVLLTNILLLDFIDWQTKFGNAGKQVMLWLDEIQNLAPAEEMVSRLFREMRKFGLGIIAVSQSVYSMSSKMQAALQQSALKLYFRQDGRGARRFASEEADTESEKKRLSKDLKTLPRGDFYAVGDFMDVNGDILNMQRRKVYHK